MQGYFQHKKNETDEARMSKLRNAKRKFRHKTTLQCSDNKYVENVSLIVIFEIHTSLGKEEWWYRTNYEWNQSWVSKFHTKAEHQNGATGTE
mmetsp:Transcript_45036/g.66290  ORF Transcript_45036/g.66290 Transcript_45036/m.66290 type:complete len:92 (-) Transcript_45036:2120-2395(-)